MSNELTLQLLKEKPFTISGLFFKHYKDIGLTDQQFLILMHIQQFHEEGNEFPTPNELIDRMTMPEQQCTQELKVLLTNRFIEIVEGKGTKGDERISEKISIEPLFEKLHLFLNAKNVKSDRNDKVALEGRLFQRFEVEFARPLSPMEMEMISMWIDDDQHAPHIIEAALRESVVSSRLNFRYIDRILFDWRKNGIRTVEEAKKHGEKVRQHHDKPKTYQKVHSSSGKTKHPGYNWLEGEET